MAKSKNQTMETAMMETSKEKATLKKIKLNEIHSKKYIEKLKETTYKDEKVVFILPSGREY